MRRIRNLQLETAANQSPNTNIQCTFTFLQGDELTLNENSHNVTIRWNRVYLHVFAFTMFLSIVVVLTTLRFDPTAGWNASLDQINACFNF